MYPVPNYNNKYGDKKMVRWKAHVTLSRDMKNATTVLVGDPKEERSTVSFSGPCTCCWSLYLAVYGSE